MPKVLAMIPPQTKPIYFVLDLGSNATHFDFLVEEHHCPTNIIGMVEEVVSCDETGLWGNDQHGLWKFVGTVEDDYDLQDYDCYKAFIDRIKEISKDA